MAKRKKKSTKTKQVATIAGNYGISSMTDMLKELYGDHMADALTYSGSWILGGNRPSLDTLRGRLSAASVGAPLKGHLQYTLTPPFSIETILQEAMADAAA